MEQFLKFAIVGLVSNGILYIGYLLLTAYGLGPKIAMSILFAIGVLQTFLFNRNWSFAYKAHDHKVFLRYVLVYLSAYCLNLAILFICIDRYQWPHQVVQGLAIIGLAFYLFTLQKFWVFRVSKQTFLPK